MAASNEGSKHEGGDASAAASVIKVPRGTLPRSADLSRLTPQILNAVPSPRDLLRVNLAWQLWLDGELRRTPLPLANGLLVVLDRPTGSVALRLDSDGRELWQVELPGIASSDPVRTQGFVAVPIGGERVVVIDVAHGQLLRANIAVDGAAVRGGIAALGGRLWVRLGKTADGLGPYLAKLDLAAPEEGLRLFPDPLGAAIETRFRRTNDTLVAAAEHPNGDALLVGIDEGSARVLWLHELRATGVVDLWAAGGLVDVVLSAGVRSWDARSGMALTRRFEGQVLEGARLAGETLLVLVSDKAQPGQRRLLTYDACTEDATGRLLGVQRIIGASSDLALLRGSDGVVMLVELPSLTPLMMPEADAIDGAELVAFSRHALWVVAHGGRSLTCLEPPE